MTTPAATAVTGVVPVVVLVAHGSRVDEANDAHRALAGTLAQRTGATVVPAYLELADPDVPTAIDHAVATGANRVVVLPYFLLPGAHTTRDIPAIIAEAGTRHPEVDLIQAAHLGADPAVVELLATQVEHLAE
jgi:sirohydrochlorin ferrochelatase